MSRQVVVTGGGTGIGRACAEHFASLGDQVTITGRRPEVLIDVAGSIGATAVPFDASDPAAVAGALDSLPLGIDILVNCAGGNADLIAGMPTNSVEQTAGERLSRLADAWRANFEANVLSAVLLAAAISDRLTDNARIITIGSIAARTGSGSYGAAKAAIEAWTIDVARQLGARGVTANVVSPGLTDGTEFFHGKLTAERRANLIEATFTKRAGKPEDIVGIVAFLGSAAARHITGQVIPVNGGAQLAR